MSSIRQELRNGILRTQLGIWIPIILGFVGLLILLYTGFSVISFYPNLPSVLKLLAGLAAILSASAYNLRIKALDYSIKLIEQGFPPECSKRKYGKNKLYFDKPCFVKFSYINLLVFLNKDYSSKLYFWKFYIVLILLNAFSLLCAIRLCAFCF